MNRELRKKLEDQVKYVMKNSRFYQNKFIHIHTEGIENFFRLPFTTKQELIDDQKNFPPFGSNLCVPIERVQRVHKTSGTTNEPLLIALTTNDIRNITDIGKRSFKEAGLDESHTVLHCLNYNMWAGGYTDHQSLEKTGATVVPFGVGNTNYLIQMILRLKANTIHCTPSYLSKIEQVLRDDFSLEPKDLNLSLGLFGAEAGIENDHFRHAIEEKWGLKAMNANYGMSEVLSILGSECTKQNGLHFRAGDIVLMELIGSDGSVKEIKENATGELVLTNLCKEAQPLIRYKTGDIIRITSTSCSCGDKSPVFQVVGRTDDMIVVKGINVFISSIAASLSKFSNMITQEYRVLVNKDEPIDNIIIQVEVSDERNRNTAVENQIENYIKVNIGINSKVELLPYNSLERTSGKSKRLHRIL